MSRTVAPLSVNNCEATKSSELKLVKCWLTVECSGFSVISVSYETVKNGKDLLAIVTLTEQSNHQFAGHVFELDSSEH